MSFLVWFWIIVAVVILGVIIWTLSQDDCSWLPEDWELDDDDPWDM